jgi:pimeloyl-ACP methyl ester carboxylesterase
VKSKDIMGSATPSVTSKDGTRIAYDKIGNGPVLILVLGTLNTRLSGTELAKRLSPQFTVISYDRRGRGESSDTLPYSPEREIEDIGTLIDESGGSVYLYGHSSGAVLAIEAAIKLGKKIKMIALYEPPYSSSDDAREATKEYNRQLAELLHAGNNDEAVALFMGLIGMPTEQVQGMRHSPMWPMLESMAPTLVYDSAVLGIDGSMPTDRLSNIRVPTLVITGSASASSLQETARALSRAIPKAELRTLDGQTHREKPEVLAPVLADFFSSTKR